MSNDNESTVSSVFEDEEERDEDDEYFQEEEHEKESLALPDSQNQGEDEKVETIAKVEMEVESLAVASVSQITLMSTTSKPVTETVSHENVTPDHNTQGLENENEDTPSSATTMGDTESLSRISNETFNTVSSDQSDKQPSTPPTNHLVAILPAVEESVRSVVENTNREKIVYREDEHISPQDIERANRSREFEHSIEDPIDLDMFRDNVIAIQAVDTKAIPINMLKPHEQEKMGKIHILINERAY